MCEQCSAKTIMFGEVVPDWFLVQATQDGLFMKAGDFGLVQGNDPDYYWSGQPRLNPCFSMTHDEFINYDQSDWEEFDELCDSISSQFNTNDPLTGYLLTQSMIEGGFVIGQKQPLTFFHWLVHRMALAHANKTNNQQT